MEASEDKDDKIDDEQNKVMGIGILRRSSISAVPPKSLCTLANRLGLGLLGFSTLRPINNINGVRCG
jgi:hypothetical protein